MRVEELSATLEILYHAATDDSVWPRALTEVADALGSTATGLVVQDKRSGRFSFAAADSRAPLPALNEYTAYYGSIDELRGFARQHRAGTIITDEMIVPTNIARHSQCYNDFYRRWELERFIGVYPRNDDECEASIIVYRDRNRPSFGADEARILNVLAPHIKHALHVRALISQARTATDTFTDTLEMLAHGIALLDQRGRVCWINTAARDLLGRNDAVTFVRGELTGTSPGTTVALQRLIKAALDELHRPPAEYTVVGSLGTYRIWAAPLQRRSADSAAALMLCIATEDAHIDARQLKQYELTPTEAALACALAEGETVREFAERRGITEQTARGHLKRVLFKTGTHRQPDLVRRLLRMSAPLRNIRV